MQLAAMRTSPTVMCIATWQYGTRHTSAGGRYMMLGSHASAVNASHIQVNNSRRLVHYPYGAHTGRVELRVEEYDEITYHLFGWKMGED
jgi:hypothetical protein